MNAKEKVEVDEGRLREEVEGNYRAFSERLDEYFRLYEGQFALMRCGEVMEFFELWEDAYKAGRLMFKDGLFSIQEVTKTPEDLGYYSHAVHLG